jgi:hydroxymethylglutaryl-CoA lyase
VSTEAKAELINQLTKSKIPVIECTSFINPSMLPQFADSRLIAEKLNKEATTKYIAFAPNYTAMRLASEDKYDGISLAVTACEETLKSSLNTSIKDLLSTVDSMVKEAKGLNLSTRAYINFCMGSLHNQDIDPKRINEVANTLHEAGVDEIVLQDNIASGTIDKLENLLNAITIPKNKLAAHFHDSHFRGMDLVIYAMSRGISTIDCAIAGLGQCPHNKSPLGNMVTEEMLYILDIMGIEHGVEWKPLLDAGDFISEAMTRENRTDVYDVDFDEELSKYKEKYGELVKSFE